MGRGDIRRRKGRRPLQKVRGHGGGLPTAQTWFGQGQKPWGLGGSRSDYQWGPLRFLGLVFVALVAVAIVVAFVVDLVR
jgi:hypothetical protein